MQIIFRGDLKSVIEIHYIGHSANARIILFWSMVQKNSEGQIFRLNILLDWTLSQAECRDSSGELKIAKNLAGFRIKYD